MLIALLALIVAATAWWLLRKPAAPAVATSPVSRGDIEQTVDATGVIDAYKLVSVGAQASGQIKSLKVQLGDTVKVESMPRLENRQMIMVLAPKKKQ